MVTKATVPADVAGVLAAAADRIERYGWHTMYPETAPDPYAARCCARARLRPLIEDWADRSGRTLEQVLAALRGAAAAERIRGA
jgi:hypothetical protein